MKTLQKDTQKQIGEYVAKDYRTAAIFKKHKIDFCCNGNITIEDACIKKGIDSQLLIEELESILHSANEQFIDYASWPLDLLIEYIEKKHHRYVEERLPILRQFLDKLCRVHGEHYPELLKINTLFTASASELASHMKKEELILFPYVKKMVNNTKIESPQFNSIKSPVSMMMQEHDHEGERFRQIAGLTNNYTPPENACNTFKATYALLEEFEKDLHLHIHLENNILFPKAIKLEQQICK